MEYKNCPNCNAKVEGFLAGYSIMSDSEVEFIKKYGNGTSDAYCTKCGPELLYKSKNDIRAQIAKAKEDLVPLIEHIPILTVQNPPNWDYDIVSIVTAQSVSGTGVFTEISATFSDLFGSQSNSLTQKIGGGETHCMNILRHKAAQLGCNAIIATDIDYSEVGSGKGMIMVCMAGTAVKVKNLETINGINAKSISQIPEAMANIDMLSSITKSVNY